MTNINFNPKIRQAFERWSAPEWEWPSQYDFEVALSNFAAGYRTAEDLAVDQQEKIKYLEGQITYLQEELSATYDELDECRDIIAGYDEGMM